MKNPVNRLATAAPRALDSLLFSKTSSSSSSSSSSNKDGMPSNRQFHLDLSGLDLGSTDGSAGGCGGSCATASVGFDVGSIAGGEDGSVADFLEDHHLPSYDFAASAATSATATTGRTPSPN